MSTPDKNHYAVIDVHPEKITLTYQGTKVVESEKVQVVREFYNGQERPPVYYFPPEDIVMDLNKQEETSGFCPLKGHANRWHLQEGQSEPYFAWSYETPFSGAAQIKGHLAFNGRLVEGFPGS